MREAVVVRQPLSKPQPQEGEPAPHVLSAPRLRPPTGSWHCWAYLAPEGSSGDAPEEGSLLEPSAGHGRVGTARVGNRIGGTSDQAGAEGPFI